MTPAEATTQYVIEESSEFTKFHLARVATIRLECQQKIQHLTAQIEALEQQLEAAHRSNGESSEPCSSEGDSDRLPSTADE